ncbi:MAG: thiol:disulfide interchange protein [uncultured bacterium]|nr:MAG: thiol:disulfide interchange protein [uncultured bacterium]
MSFKRFLYVVSLFAVCFTLSHQSLSKEIGGEDENPFIVSFEEGPLVVKPGEKVAFNVHFQIPSGHYLYEDKVNLDIKASAQIKIGDISKTDSVPKADPFLGMTVNVYYDQADLFLNMTMPDQMGTEQILKGQILYQGCSHELCFRPMKIPFEVTYVSRQPSPVPDAQKTSANQEISFWQKIQGALKNPDQMDFLNSKDFLFSLLIAFLGGVLSDFTPCVWPMIPVTMVIIGVRKDKSRLHNLLAALVLVMGMAVMYSLLGMASAILGKSLGFLFQQTFFLWLLFAVMLLMGLSLFGLFEFRLPPRFLTWLANLTATGYRGIFLVGFTLGVLAAPCVGPVIGSILIYVAQTQDVWFGFWLMLFYALGMGSLFVLMGLIYKTIQLKAKSNAFTVIFKKILGVAILMVAVYYGLIAYHQVAGDKQKESYWSESYEAGFELAKSEHKPLLIDFYADWCLPCKELDTKVWKQPDMAEYLSKNYVAVHIDCTQDSKECREAVDRYKIIGWPTIVFLNKNQQEVQSERLVGKVIEKEEMLQILDRIKSL